MNVQNSDARFGGGQIDLQTALIVRTWCDEKFAFAYKSDRAAAVRAFLKENDLDESLEASLGGELPASPIGFEDKKPVIQALFETNAGCLSPSCTSEEWYCPAFTIYCHTSDWYDCPASHDCPPETTTAWSNQTCT